jgi:hypothetical protein
MQQPLIGSQVKLDGLEMQLLVLQDLAATCVFTGTDIDACAECFQTIELCLCKKPLRWPIKEVIRKLHNKLTRYRSA